MTTKILASSIAAAIALAGCAALSDTQTASWPPSKPPGPPCNAQVCFVKVTVTASCAFTAKPEPAHIGKSTHDIHWDLQSSAGHTFTTDGISFKPPNPFTQPQRLTPTKFKWTDNNGAGTPSTPYKYTVNVTGGPTPCPPWDPTVWNE